MRLIKLAAACGLAVVSTVSWAVAQGAPSPAELVFTPVAPCRAFATSTALAANGERTFAVSGPSSAFTAQGGPSAGCGVPASATAVAISFTSFGSAGAGHLRSTAFGDPVISNTQVLSFSNNATVTTGAIVSVKQGKFTIRSFSGSTKLLGDITGYYAPPIHVVVFVDGTIYSKTSRVIRVVNISTGAYDVYVDRSAYYCSASVTPISQNTSFSASIIDNVIRVLFTRSKDDTAVNAPFQLTVSC